MAPSDEDVLVLSRPVDGGGGALGWRQPGFGAAQLLQDRRKLPGIGIVVRAGYRVQQSVFDQP